MITSRVENSAIHRAVSFGGILHPTILYLVNIAGAYQDMTGLFLELICYRFDNNPAVHKT